jgi:hypothetical protein
MFTYLKWHQRELKRVLVAQGFVSTSTVYTAAVSPEICRMLQHLTHLVLFTFKEDQEMTQLERQQEETITEFISTICIKYDPSCIEAMIFRVCRVQEHTLMPNETVYTRVYHPIPQDRDYYIVGFLANIVNKIHMHHMVASFCTAGIESLYKPPRDAGFPEQPRNESDVGMSLKLT